MKPVQEIEINGEVNVGVFGGQIPGAARPQVAGVGASEDKDRLWVVLDHRLDGLHCQLRTGGSIGLDRNPRSMLGHNGVQLQELGIAGRKLEPVEIHLPNTSKHSLLKYGAYVVRSQISELGGLVEHDQALGEPVGYSPGFVWVRVEYDRPLDTVSDQSGHQGVEGVARDGLVESAAIEMGVDEGATVIFRWIGQSYGGGRRRGTYRGHGRGCNWAENLHPVISSVGNVNVPESVYRYAVWLVKLAVVAAFSSPFEQEPPIAIEYLTPVIPCVSQKDVSGPVHGYTPWPIEPAVIGALSSPLEQQSAITIEYLHPVIGCIGYVHVPGLVHGYTFRILELAVAFPSRSVSEYSLRPTMYIMHIVLWYD